MKKHIKKMIIFFSFFIILYWGAIVYSDKVDSELLYVYIFSLLGAYFSALMRFTFDRFVSGYTEERRGVRLYFRE